MRDTDTLLIAVDEHDRETGVVEKMAAHRKGILHRAFSIFVSPTPDAREVRAWKWERLPALQSLLAEDPKAFTAWFRLALDGLLARGLP